MSTLENHTLHREKWGLEGYTLFLILAQKHELWILKQPHCGGSNKHGQRMFGSKIKDNAINYCFVNDTFRANIVQWCFFKTVLCVQTNHGAHCWVAFLLVLPTIYRKTYFIYFYIFLLLSYFFCQVFPSPQNNNFISIASFQVFRCL